MHLNSLKLLDSLPITEITPNDSHIQIAPVEFPAHEPSSATLTTDGNYLGQRGSSLTNQKTELLRQTLEQHRHERQLVILQDFPDPDALSCAWAYQLIASNTTFNAISCMLAP